jgi:hypothetical protein
MTFGAPGFTSNRPTVPTGVLDRTHHPVHDQHVLQAASMALRPSISVARMIREAP